jgi:methionyl-tRNA synthetase
MSKPQKTTITAALPYANGPVHVGHIAGCYLPADIYYRYLIARGRDALFICGSDEHGVPITIRAQKEGMTYQEVVDKYHRLMRNAFADFGISFTHYGRTSAPIHHQTASDFFRKLYENNGFSEETTSQFYDEAAGKFLADRYVTGTCPKCGNPAAYGDQCERCGSSLNATDLIDAKSAITGNKPILKETKNWFLPLDELQKEFVDAYIEDKKDQWKLHVYGQCKTWLNEGLKPRAMTRDLDWGVKVPIEDAPNKVLYVWFDAPIGYISSTKEYFEEIRKADAWKDWWIKNEAYDQKLVHFIGKDNIVFHCIIFPAMLFAHNKYNKGGEQFLIPDAVPANEFLNLEGEKISTSRNWAVWLHEYLEDFKGNTDELRYYLTKIAPENADSDFTWKGYQLAVNSELVAILGNFVNRVVVLIHKFYEGRVPQNYGANIVSEMFLGLRNKTSNIEKYIEQYKFRDGQEELMNICRQGNKFLAETEPWHLIKTDPQRTAGLLENAVQYCVSLGILCKPFLPKTSENIQKMFNISDEDYIWSQIGNENLLPQGHFLNPAVHLFKNIEDADIQKQIDKLAATKAGNNSTPETNEIQEPKAEIVYEDFAKMDIRIGTITAAIKVPKADRLLQLTIDTGLDERTIVSGIAEHYTPEDIIGKQVLVLVNLAPRKMKGIESRGMILMAKDKEGKLIFVKPEKAINTGADVS